MAARDKTCGRHISILILIKISLVQIIDTISGSVQSYQRVGGSCETVKNVGVEAPVLDIHILSLLKRIQELEKVVDMSL